MDFEWDVDKSDTTRRRRGFSFAFAAGIFVGPIFEVPDERRDYGERRIRAIGRTGGLVLLVVYTDRGDVRRIISARKANRKERTQWLNLFA